MQNNITEQKILLVGCGKMGFALLQGMTEAGVLLRNVIVVDPDTVAVHDKFNVRILKGFNSSEIEEFAPDIIIFAVKPQVIESILPDYKQFSGRSLFISVIAGKTIPYFEKHLGTDAAVIRTMPNLPVAISEGMTVASKNHNVTSLQALIIESIFGKIGTVYGDFIDEKMLDAVTAISGSGPAYVFYFMECLIDAAKKLGLNEEMATTLVYQTIRGSSGLAMKSPKSATELRQMVTSPAGTTEAALKILMQGNKVPEIIAESAKAAFERSKELSE